ncbi:hypothetical protein CPAV1605_856 [seawater metagenome]|uniref:Uncharacterized protein n=1 Tax=seawater metagenome TaxID=1561972 RepID=A0A5E8CIT0_9ZZZZ
MNLIVTLLVLYFLVTVFKRQTLVNSMNRKMLIITAVITMLFFLNKSDNYDLLSQTPNKRSSCVLFMALIVGFFVFQDNLVEGMANNCTIDNAWYKMQNVTACQNIVPSSNNDFFKFTKAQDGGLSKYIKDPQDYNTCLNWLNNNQGCHFTPIDKKQEEQIPEDPIYDQVPDEWNVFTKYKKEECLDDVKGEWCEADETCYTQDNWPGNQTCVPTKPSVPSYKPPQEESKPSSQDNLNTDDIPPHLLPGQTEQSYCDVYAYGPQGSKWQRINPSQQSCTSKADSFMVGEKMYPSCDKFNQDAVNYAQNNCPLNSDKECIQKEVGNYLKNTNDTMCLTQN